jgi:Leu/Phe-tRNA-protein transferase
MIFLQDHQVFPLVVATGEGISAMSMKLSITRPGGYHKENFSWYNTDEPVLWCSSDLNMVLLPNELK